MLRPADPADQWRYDLYLTPGIVDRKLTWCDGTVEELFTALEHFTTGWSAGKAQAPNNRIQPARSRAADAGP